MESIGRVEPLPEPWSDADGASIERWGHPAATYDPLLLVRCLQRHPGLAGRVRDLGEGIYVEGRLPPRMRTIAILRACGLIGCAYEWGGQAAFWGPLTDMRESECDALALPDAGRAWSEDECTLIAAVEELEQSGSWREQTWSALGGFLDDEQRMELLTVVGWYRMIATLCNAMALPVDAWMRSWPASAGVAAS